MAKKIVKRKKLRVFRLLIVLIVLGGLFFGGYLFVKLPIKNIIVKNNIIPLLEINIDNYYLAASFELWKYIECEKYKFGIDGT